MKRKNLTRNALFTSIVSLLLCVSMLVGTTFAWFTDEVVSGRNTIAAGNLDVELLANGVAVNEGTVLFNTDVNGNAIKLWEPGMVVYENLQIANKGTLDLKYRLSVEAYAENELEGHKLSEVVKLAVLDEPIDKATANRADILKAAKEAGSISLADFELIGSLEAKTDGANQAVVIFWEPGDNDNLYNANNGKQTSDGQPLFIEFKVNLFATQIESEKDSFGPDYDGGAPWITAASIDWYLNAEDGATEYTITSAEDLAGLAAIVNGTADAGMATYAMRSTTIQDDFAGKTIKLANNIDLSNNAWTPIGNWDYAFNGTFDGQGNTISNLYINMPEGEGVGLFGVAQNATIKGINIENVNISGYSMVAGVVGAAYPANISDCEITGDVKIVADWAYVAGVAGYCYYGTQVNGCSVVAEGTGLIQSNTRNAVGGITAWLLEGNHKVADCHVKNLNLVGWTNVGGITGFVHYNNIIEDCSVENVKLIKTREDGNPGIGLIAGGWSYSASNAITLRSNTVKSATMEGNHVAYSAYNELYGSEYGGATTTNFVLENNTTEGITNNLAEVTKITDGIVDNNGVKQIYNANGLKTLSAAKISGNYELIADIDMGGAEFSAISAWYASATFNGNGHTISNVKLVSGDNDNGMEQASMFFVSTKGSLTVSDLTLKDITVTTKNIDNGYAAAVIGYCEGAAVLNNVDVVNANITGSKSSGLLVGHLTGTGSLTAADCDVAGTITLSDFEANGHYAGKYFGTLAGPADLTDCTAKVTLGGNLHANNIGDIYGRKTGTGTLVIDGKNVIATAADLQAALDKATSNTTIQLTSGVNYGTVILGRPTKSNDTVMYCENHDYTTTDAAEYKAHVSDGAWHATPQYTTTIDGLTIIGAEGATISGLTASSGHAYNNPQDEVLGTTNGYYATLKMSNITFQNVNFTGKIDINSSQAESVYDGITFDGCSFTTGGTESSNGAAIRYYNESNNGNVKNIVVENCTFNNCYQGVYVHHVNGITVTGSTFDTTGHNAIAMQGHNGAVNLKKVVITGNTFKNIGDRVIRFNDVDADSNITIQNNVATNSGNTSGEIMKATSIAAGIKTDIKGNTWNGTVVNAELQDK